MVEDGNCLNAWILIRIGTRGIVTLREFIKLEVTVPIIPTGAVLANVLDNQMRGTDIRCESGLDPWTQVNARSPPEFSGVCICSVCRMCRLRGSHHEYGEDRGQHYQSVSSSISSNQLDYLTHSVTVIVWLGASSVTPSSFV